MELTAVEAEGCGIVLTGTPRSIRLTLDDAARHGAEKVTFLSAAGQLVDLTVRDELGPVCWRVREAEW